MKEVLIALLSSSITIVITSFFNYYFLRAKEMRSQSNQYKIDILTNIYTPMLKKLLSAVVPGDGYEGVRPETLSEIEKIMSEHYVLVDPDLSALIWLIQEDVRWDHYEDGIRLFDENKVLLKYVERNFNYYRKQLGLPYDRKKLKKSRLK